MIKSRDILINICVKELKKRDLYSDTYKQRLMDEIYEIDAQDEHDYIIKTRNRLIEEKKVFHINETNSLVYWLLDMVQDFDINKPYEIVLGEFPDIDVDYIPSIKEYIKKEWSVKQFGIDNTCSIANYGTYKPKSALIDAARVYGLDRNEILALTKKMGLKDDEGEQLEIESALRMFPDLKAYCDKYPHVLDAANRITGRIKQIGEHAGGLIISSTRLDELVPLVKPSGDQSYYISAFTEGQSSSDLGPLGLIKFDVLAVLDLYRCYVISDLVRKRHNLEEISAKPGRESWSDTSYLNDPKALDLANKANIKNVFQFDSEGMRKMVKAGGVNSFDDLVAYTALYRPGPMGMDMHNSFIKRKNKEEDYERHPALEGILGASYYVMCYQESVLKILSLVGSIPQSQCEKIRKAISKKKEAVFGKYKEMFVENGQNILSWPREKLERLWQEIESFAEYGFNLSHSVAYTYLSAKLLWLKAHYPLEFFAGSLQVEDNFEKMKEIMTDAKNFGIEVCPLDLNKSKVSFSIGEDNKIYMGFSNVKGIGAEIAENIVAKQPYSSFEDFINRFGVDANVLKPLIALGIFKDGRPEQLYEYYEYFKDFKKKQKDRDSRFEISTRKVINEIKENIDEKYYNKIDLLIREIGQFEKPSGFELWFYSNFPDCQSCKLNELYKLLKKAYRSYSSNQAKNSIPIRAFKDFQFTGKIDEELKSIYSQHIGVAEKLHYGYAWNHAIASSPDYTGGLSLSRFNDPENMILCIEGQIKKPAQKILSKSGKEYYSMIIEDEDFQEARINIWKEDFERFQEEFTYFDENNGGLMVKIRLHRPTNGFSTYTFESFPKFKKNLIPKEKKYDHRLKIMRFPEKKN